MKIRLVSGPVERVSATLLVLPVWEGELETGDLTRLDRRLKGYLSREWKRRGFTGKEATSLLFSTRGELASPYLLLVGMGKREETSPDSWRALADAAVRSGRDIKAKTIGLGISRNGAMEETVTAVTEGVLLANYRFDRFKTKDVREEKVLEEIVLCGKDLSPKTCTQARRWGELLAEATAYARDLINLPAAVATPSYLGEEARGIGRERGLAVRVFSRREMEKMGMRAILGVSQGSAREPCFIHMTYVPEVRAARSIALVGKGITFDSGGLSLKSSEAMETMKRDMAGGAVVLAVMKALARWRPPVEVRGYVPATENMPSGNALKPGDVLGTYSGKTVEVLNTDAEGRLVLADALTYACHAKPDVLIDIATLTGAIRVALGPRAAGIMGTDEGLIQALLAAGREAGELFWPLPLVKEYRSDLESAVADLKNTGSGSAGAIVAGLFLREFVADVPWAHLDIAGVAFTDKNLPCIPRGAVGFGVRTILRYLRRLSG